MTASDRPGAVGPTVARAAASEQPPGGAWAIGPEAPVPAELTVLYDATCPLCVRCRHWLESQRTYVPLRFEATDAPAAVERYGADLPWLGYELIVLDDAGHAWIGPAAFLVCLWATVEHRDLSYRLSGPAFAPMAEWFFRRVSSHRRGIGRLLTDRCEGERCAHRPPGLALF